MVTRKRIKSFIQLCIDWCLIDRSETGLVRIRAQICNIISLIFLERAIFGHYPAYSWLYYVGKTIIWFIVELWWFWVRKIFFCWREGENGNSSVWPHREWHGGNILRRQMTDSIYIHEQLFKLSKMIFLIHNHHHFTINQIIVFPTWYSEEYASFWKYLTDYVASLLTDAY